MTAPNCRIPLLMRAPVPEPAAPLPEEGRRRFSAPHGAEPQQALKRALKRAPRRSPGPRSVPEPEPDVIRYVRMTVVCDESWRKGARRRSFDRNRQDIGRRQPPPVGQDTLPAKDAAGIAFVGERIEL